MKKLITLLAFSTLVFQASTSLKAATTSPNASASSCCVINSQTIISYLRCLGYTVLTTPTQVAFNKWTAQVSIRGLKYKINVYTSGSSILGHEDIPI